MAIWTKNIERIYLANRFAFLGLAMFCSAIQAQQISLEKLQQIYEKAEPCVVRLASTGVKDGRELATTTGIGFIVRTTGGSRVITAGHVVGKDEDYDSVPGTVTLRRRDISLRIGSTYGPTSVGPLHAARLNPEFDIAQVFLDKGPPNCLALSRLRPVLGDDLVVVSWQAGAANSQPTPVQILPGNPDDGDLIRVDRKFDEGESGAPILDQNGNVVAMLLARNVAGYSTALPVALLPNWIPDATYAAPFVDKREAVFRSGARESGTLANFSSFYELCSERLLGGARIVDHQFRLEGDRTCGAYSECKLSVQDASQVCYVFRLQGHSELPFSNSGVRQSEGVLRINYLVTQER